MNNNWASIINRTMYSPGMKKCAVDIEWINGMTIPELVKTLEGFADKIKDSVDPGDVRVICTDNYGNLRAYYSVPMTAEEATSETDNS